MKRAGWLERSKPLERTRIKRKPARRVAKETPAERQYKAWIHEQECVGHAAFPVGHVCWGGIEQSHERDMAGMGLKSNNLRSVAMCRSLHQQWEQHTCRFVDWTKEDRREWMKARIAEANAKFDAELGQP